MVDVLVLACHRGLHVIPGSAFWDILENSGGGQVSRYLMTAAASFS